MSEPIDVDALAKAIAKALDLAVVQRVPRVLMDILDDTTENVFPMYGTKYQNVVNVRVSKLGNEIQLRFTVNDQTLAVFRFEGRI